MWPAAAVRGGHESVCHRAGTWLSVYIATIDLPLTRVQAKLSVAKRVVHQTSTGDAHSQVSEPPRAHPVTEAREKGKNMGKNGDLVRASTEHYNNRDFQTWLACFAPDATFVDLSQGVTASGHDELLAYGHTWITALSDACYANTRITEAGSTVILQFDGQGVNDGPFGSFPATGKRVSFPVFNVISVNDDGQIVRIEQLYDRLDILIQLGHMPPG